MTNQEKANLRQHLPALEAAEWACREAETALGQRETGPYDGEFRHVQQIAGHIEIAVKALHDLTGPAADIERPAA